MPDSDTADRVIMRFAERIHGRTITGHPMMGYRQAQEAHDKKLKQTAAALSSHGLREMVLACEMLKPVADIIQAVDGRCSAADGPVTPTEREISQAELKNLLALAWAAAFKADVVLTDLLGEGETSKAEEQQNAG